MGQYIIKLTDPKDQKDYYLRWSDSVDAPISYGMSLEEFKESYKEEFGKSGLAGLEDRLLRVEKTGSSGHPPFGCFENLLSSNKAGKNRQHAEIDEILELYCRNHIG